MALPYSFTGVAFPAETNNVLGPFIDGNGNEYLVFLDSTDLSLVEVHKATAAGSYENWTEQDVSNKPNAAADIDAMSAFYDSANEIIHIAAQQSDGNVSHFPFRTSGHASADTWGTLENNIAAGTGISNESIAIGKRSDGDLIIVFAGAEDTIKGTKYGRIDYIRWEGASWSSPIAVDDAGANDFRGCALVMGASDKAHIIYQADNLDNIYHKSLSSTNTLSSAEAVNDTAIAEMSSMGAIAYYDASGTERITVAWQKASDSTVYTSEIDNDGTPGAEESAGGAASVVTDIPPFVTTSGADDIVYIHYVDSATNDLWHDANDNSGGWGTDVETLDAVTVNKVYGRTFVRSGATIFAFVYLDGTTIKYNEYTLISGGSITVTPGAASVQLTATDPTTGLGSLSLSDAADVQFTATDPSTGLGSLSLSDSASVQLTATDPTTTLGSLTLSDAADVQLTATDPSVSLGSDSVTPSAANVQFTATDPTTDLGSLALSDSASVQFTATDPTIDIALVFTPAPASVQFAATDPTVTLGSLALSDAAGVQFTATDPSIDLGSLALSDVANVQFTATDPSIALGSLTLSDNADVQLTATDPTIDIGGAGSIIVTPAAASVQFIATDPGITLGSVTATPSASGVQLTATDPNIGLGSLTLSDSASVQLVATDPTISLGSLILNDSADVQLTATDPSIGLGSLNLSDVAGVQLTAADPTIDLGSLAFSDTAAVQLTATDPSIDLGSLVLGDSADVQFTATDPTTDLGSLSLSDTSSVQFAATDPTINILSGGSQIVTPSVATVQFTATDPDIRIVWAIGVPSESALRVSAEGTLQATGEGAIRVRPER